MAGMKISELDFVRLLPVFMRDDETITALSNAMNKLLGEPGKRLGTLSTWSKFDDLTEEECDALAWELDVDWYDPESMGLAEKRETLKTAQQIKRKRGTKWAVERLISAYFGTGYVVEWFEMEGLAPYTFVALTTNANITDENYGKFIEAVKAAKNERSHIAGVFYLWEQGPDPGIEYALGSSLHRYGFEKCGTLHRTATVGFTAKPSVETEPEAELHRYSFQKAGTQICGIYSRPGTLGAVKRSAISTAPETSFAAYSFAKCGTQVCGIYPRIGTNGAANQFKTAIESADAFTTYGFTKCGTQVCGN